MKNILRFLSISLFATLTSCVNSDDYGTPDLSGECSNLTATRSTLDILGLATNSIQQFGTAYDNDIIEAVVTSSDEGGNIYKSLSLISLDGTKGFSIPIDDYNLYTKYEPGRKVFINLKGNFFQFNNTTSTVEIGSNYQGKVGRLSGIVYRDVIKRSCENVGEENIVNKLTIAQAKNNSNINKLVEIENVQFVDASVGKTYFDATLNSIGGATNHTLRDADGNTILVRISEYATFSKNKVATGNGKIRGVLTKYNNDYQFMIRTENDVQMDNPRILPFYQETFETTYNDWTKFSVSGGQTWTLVDFGNPGKCADINGFVSGASQVNEDWLISPAIDLSTIPSATLSFQTAKNFSGNSLQVYVSTNYIGSGTPSAATWTLLGGSLATASNFAWRDSGNVSLASYLGNTNVRIAFKYTSTSSAAAQWRVDNVRID